MATWRSRSGSFLPLLVVGVVAALAAGCGGSTPLPALDALPRLQPGPAPDTARWEALGFSGVDSASVIPATERAGRAPVAPVTVLVVEPGAWPEARVLRTLGRLADHFAHCSLSAPRMTVLRFDAVPPAAAALDWRSLVATRVPARWPVGPGPVVLLGERVAEPDGRHRYAGRLVSHEDGELVVLGRGASSDEAASVLAHELGHVAGLEHAPRAAAGDLMAPTACAQCRFSDADCARLRRRAGT